MFLLENICIIIHVTNVEIIPWDMLVNAYVFLQSVEW